MKEIVLLISKCGECPFYMADNKCRYLKSAYCSPYKVPSDCPLTDSSKNKYSTEDLRVMVNKFCADACSSPCNGDTCYIDDFISWLELEGKI